MALKLGCIERLTFGKEGVEKIQNFHGDMPDYINRAVAGENRYDLEIDKDWTQFIYESSKMSWIKLLVLLIGILPSLTKFSSFFMQKLLISGCQFYIKDEYHYGDPLPLTDCIKYNGGTQFIDKNFFHLNSYELFSAVIFFIILAVPHWIFIVLVCLRFKTNKFIAWLSSAKIHLTTFDKRLLTFGYFLGCLCLIGGSAYVTSFIMDMNVDFFRKNLFVPFNSAQDLVYVFDKSDLGSLGNTVTTALIYSCLLTVLFTHIREPLAFFTGFGMYLKKASHVPYNTAAIDFRIKKDAITWKFIRMYYEKCERYPPNIVLNAMTTQFIDLKYLQVDQIDALTINPKNSKLE